MIREATAFLLEALSGDRPEQAALQSKLLEINLVTNPQVLEVVVQIKSAQEEKGMQEQHVECVFICLWWGGRQRVGMDWEGCHTGVTTWFQSHI